MASSRLGTFRAVYLVALCCVGSFLFAYDTGIVGGILTFKSFQRDFRYSADDRASVGSNSTSLLQAGGKPVPKSLAVCLYVMPLLTCLDDSILRLFLHLALHRPIRPTLVSRSRLPYLQHRCRRADHKYTFAGCLLRGSSGQRCRSRHGHRHRAHVLGRDGAKEHPRNAGEHVPVLLHHGRHDFVLDRLRCSQACTGLDGTVADSCWSADRSRCDLGSGHAPDKGESSMVGQAGPSRGGFRGAGLDPGRRVR